jgi:hypothetical protein
MSRVTHELIVRDKGLHSQRASLRSGVVEPNRTPGNLSEIICEESTLPPDVSDYLLSLSECHTRKLAQVIGERWMEGTEGGSE